MSAIWLMHELPIPLDHSDGEWRWQKLGRGIVASNAGSQEVCHVWNE